MGLWKRVGTALSKNQRRKILFPDVGAVQLERVAQVVINMMQISELRGSF
jgi:hypothetical protein